MEFAVRSPTLIARNSVTFMDVFEYADFLIETVKAKLPAGAIKPGFQYHPSLLALEQSPETFASGDALGAFARAAAERPKDELEAEALKVRHLAHLVAQNTPARTLQNRCLDISWILMGLLEQLGIWAITYRGTLLYIGRMGRITGKLYYINDVLEPPERDNQARGHSWVWTPSVPVVDLTAKYQRLPSAIARHLPSLILSRDEQSPGDLSGLYYDEAGPMGYQDAAKEYFSWRKVWPEWNRLHKPVEVPGQITLRYMPMDIGFPAAPLVENPGYAQDIKIGGLSPLEFLDIRRTELNES